jgi:Rrf2 family protein
MLTNTSISAIQTLVFLARRDPEAPVSPGSIAECLGTSPSYQAKIHTQLAKAGILTSIRGTQGGVRMARAAETITLLEVVEVCQGRILGDYCTPHDRLEEVCAFHQAMYELQSGVIATLSRWTIEDLRERPMPAPHLRGIAPCRMGCTSPQNTPDQSTGPR